MKRNAMAMTHRKNRILAALALATFMQHFVSATVPQISAQTAPATGELLENTERELKGREVHSYRVQLNAGDFLYALIEQKEIDLAVIVSGADEKQLSVTDSPNDRFGTEPVLILSSTSGSYRIDIRGPNSQTAVGRYAIKIIAKRPATDADKNHVKAQRTFEEAQKLLAQPAGDSRRAAIEKFKEASSGFKAASDVYRRALAIRAAGRAHGLLGEFRPAAGYWSEALDLVRALDDQRLEAGLETDLGFAHDVFGDVDKSLEHYSRALTLARTLKSTSAEAIVLNNIGKIYNDIADWGKALDYYLQALPLIRSVGNTRLEGIALNNIGIAYSRAGEHEKGRTYLQESLELLRKGNDKNAEAYTLSNIGSTYSGERDYEKALGYYEQALTFQNQTGNRAQQAETLDLMGIAYTGLGQYEKAIEHHQRAVAIHRSTENLRREALSLKNLGIGYTLLSQPAKAIENFDKSLVILRGIRDLDNVASALAARAEAEWAQGKFATARRDAEEALSLTETVRVRAGSQQLRSSYLASSEQIYEFYIDILMQHHRANPNAGFDAEAFKASERGRARSLMEMLAESTVGIRRGVNPDLVKREKELSNLLNAKAQRHIQLLSQKGGAGEIAILTREMSSLEDEYQQLQATIRRNSPAYAALMQPQPLGLKEVQKQLDVDTLLLEYSLGDKRSYLWVVTTDSLNSFELPGREVIEKSARRTYDLLTARSQVRPRETAAEKRERIVAADRELEIAVAELSKLVLEPAGSSLRAKRLVIVADDALQYVPFAGLTVGVGSPTKAEPADASRAFQPLVLNHEIVTLPSASAFALHRQNLLNRRPARNAVAVIADPVFSVADDRFEMNALSKSSGGERTDDHDRTRIIEHISDEASGELAIRRLRFTRQEAQQILAVVPQRSNLRALDFNANRAIATGGVLSRYRYVHFATHGYIDSERPDLSAIVLSLVDQHGNPEDGFLRAHEIYNLNLPAEVVVLSACQTGLGKEIKGEGLIGLTRGFMYAGARRVVVSLWNVNDKATAELMKRFYRGMLREKLTPAAALRQAQTEMLQHPQWNAPYYWAAFVLQGEWK